MTAEEVQKHIFISGRVQGVGFRAFVRRQAAELDIKGWAKNLADGRVEIVIMGNQNEIDQMLAKIKKGPSFARVENLEIKTEKPSDYDNFKIRF